MFKYSAVSEARLKSCEPCLQLVMRTVLGYRDHSILVGHRGKIAQDLAYLNGFSKKPWPEGDRKSTRLNSSHSSPSRMPSSA